MIVRCLEIENTIKKVVIVRCLEIENTIKKVTAPKVPVWSPTTVLIRPNQDLLRNSEWDAVWLRWYGRNQNIHKLCVYIGRTPDNLVAFRCISCNRRSETKRMRPTSRYVYLFGIKVWLLH